MAGVTAAGRALLTAAAAAALTGCTGGSPTGSAPATGAPKVATSGPAFTLEQQYEDVIKAVLPSVVQIGTGAAVGSGVIYDSKGDIVTNAHVVGDSATVRVLSAVGGGVLDAHVIGAFAPDDLAVIRVTSRAGSLRPAVFGPSTDVTTGQIVMAMGNPLGLTGSVTQGIISAIGRTVDESGAAGGTTTISGVLQTSAAINDGNSGGALVNLSGQVIGIPTAAARDPQAGPAPDIGFAIPSDTVTRIVDKLISKGKVTGSGRATLGVTGSTAVAPSGQVAGVTVASVTQGGPADKAGLRAGDVITSVDGEQTASLSALTAALAALEPGAKVPVTYTRSHASYTATVTLGALPGKR